MADRTTIQRQEDHLRRAEILERLGVLAKCEGPQSQAARAEARGLCDEMRLLEGGQVARLGCPSHDNPEGELTDDR